MDASLTHTSTIWARAVVVMFFACMASLAADTATASHDASATASARLPVKLGLRQYVSVADRGVELIVTSRARVQCHLIVRAKDAKERFRPVVTNRKGRVRLRWAVSSKSPTGTWRFAARCKKILRRGKRRVVVRRGAARARGFVFTSGGEGKRLYGPSTGRLFAGGTVRTREERRRYGFSSRTAIRSASASARRNPFPFGECTWYAHERRPDVGWAVLSFGYADAHTWDERAKAKGFPVSSRPAAGTLAVWESQQNGAHGPGHVAYVTRVLPGGRVRVSDYNWVGIHAPGSHVVSIAGLDFIYRKGQHPGKPKPKPPADSDGDGIPDGTDVCPTLPGTGSGCPTIQTQRARGNFDGSGGEDLAIAHRRSDGGLNLWVAPSRGSAFGAPESWSAGPPGFDFASMKLVAGDFNDDGRDDVVAMHKRSSNGGVNLWFFRSTGTSFAAPVLWHSNPSGFSYNWLKGVPGDFDNDGRDDLAIVHKRSNGGLNIWVFHSTGSSFSSPAAWSTNPPGFGYDISRVTAGNFDGSGGDDILAIHKRTSDGGINLWLFSSNGSSFGPPTLWNSNPPGFSYDRLGGHSADFDGDGREDLVIAHKRVSNGGVNLWFFRSTGSGFASPALWMGNPSGFLYSKSRYVPADVNNDGLADLIIVHLRASDGGLNAHVLKSSGYSFGAPTPWLTNPAGFVFNLSSPL